MLVENAHPRAVLLRVSDLVHVEWDPEIRISTGMPVNLRQVVLRSHFQKH